MVSIFEIVLDVFCFFVVPLSDWIPQSFSIPRALLRRKSSSRSEVSNYIVNVYAVFCLLSEDTVRGVGHSISIRSVKIAVFVVNERDELYYSYNISLARSLGTCATATSSRMTGPRFEFFTAPVLDTMKRTSKYLRYS